MNHGNKAIKFASSKSQRMAMLRNLSVSLLKYEHIETTRARASAVVPYLEKILTRSRKSTDSFRYLFKYLNDKEISEKVVDVFFKRYKDNEAGLVQSYKLGFRKGDGAELHLVCMKGYAPKTKSKLKKVKKVEAEESTEEKTEGSGLKGLTKKIKNIASRDNAKEGKSATFANKTKAKTRSGI